MLLHQPVVIDVPHDMAVGNILFLGIAQEGHDAAQEATRPLYISSLVPKGGRKYSPSFFRERSQDFPEPI